MKKYLLFSGVLLSLAVFLVACGGKPTQPPTQALTEVITQAPTQAPTEAPVALTGDALLGGKLYDSWIDEIGAEAPVDNQPLWATSTSAASDVAPEETWLCVSCHGVDYNGDNGFPGILADSAIDPNEILAILKGSTNPNHDFSSVMDDQQLTDIALFTNQYVVDITSIVKDGQPVNANPDNGKTLFEDTCTDCHGPQAVAINFHSDAEPEYPATIANENPAELLGKVRFGVPGMPDMPSGIDNGWSNQDFSDIISYIAALPTSSPVTEGGRFYDNWPAALQMDAPEGNQPLWTGPLTSGGEDIGAADTWRCSSCHGWDYKGSEGFTGILDASSKSSEELTAWLDGTKNADHNFSAAMPADAISRLVIFMQEGMVDKTFINADNTVTGGDAVHGKQLFLASCKTCHGPEGTLVNFAEADGGTEYVGTVANDNPLEFFNKASFGQPGEPMLAGWNLGWVKQDIIDLLTFAQTLPVK